MVRFTVITAFPDFFNSFLSAGVVGKGVKAGLIQINIVDLRSFGKGAYRQIDDYAFGSGGMVLMAEPLEEALNSIRTGKDFVVYPSPQGALLTQEVVESFFHQSHVVIICGRYEGIDERFVEREVDLEITIGDCVLTGGEIPAMAVIDAVSRLIPGVVGNEEAVAEDSFYRGMLDTPHYTRPSSWMGMNAPEVLLSGNSAEISNWRRKQAVERTILRRPELLARSSLRGYLRGGFYLSFEYKTHGMEQIEELAALCESYDAARLLLIVASPEEREILRQFVNTKDFPGRDRIKLMPSLNLALSWVKEKSKAANLSSRQVVVDVRNRPSEGSRHWLDTKRFIFDNGGSVVFFFSEEDYGTERGLKNDADYLILTMLPIESGKLPFSGRFAVILDRFLGF